MSQVFKTTKYSDYLGEERPLLDIYVNFENPPVSPSVTPTISLTPSVSPTISVTPSVTPSLNSSPTPTPSFTSTPTTTTTPTLSPTNTSTPTLTPTQSPSAPLPSLQSITFSGNGSFGRYNGTYVLTEPKGKVVQSKQISSTSQYWAWSNTFKTSGQSTFLAMLYNPSNIQEVFHGGQSFVTIIDTRWATTYPAGPLMLVSSSQGTPFFSGSSLNIIDGLEYPSEGTFGAVFPHTGSVTISYNF